MGASQVAQLVKNLPANAEDTLEEDMATHSSILAWEISRTGAQPATVHGVAKSQTQLRYWAYTHITDKVKFKRLIVMCNDFETLAIN